MNIANQKKMYLCALIVLVAALCAAPAMAGDIEVYSNLGSGQSFNSAQGWVVDGADYSSQVIASSFTPTTTAHLADALLALINQGGNNSPVSVYLESDNSGLPDSIMDTLTQQGTLPPYGATGPVTTFICTACPLMDAGTQYWIVALETDPNSAQGWMWSNSDVGTFAYNHSGNATGPWESEDYNVSAFQVDGSTTAPTVPEPGSMLLMATFLMALGPIVRKKLW